MKNPHLRITEKEMLELTKSLPVGVCASYSFASNGVFLIQDDVNKDICEILARVRNKDLQQIMAEIMPK